jgi:hypothetical protein
MPFTQALGWLAVGSNRTSRSEILASMCLDRAQSILKFALSVIDGPRFLAKER